MKKSKFIKILIIAILVVISLGIGAFAAYTYNASDVNYNGTTVAAALNDLYAKMPTKDYSAGDTVWFGGERFYVLEDSYAGETKVEIIARSCLNNSDYSTQCADSATEDNYRCAFSTSNYWSSETSYPFNLNTYAAVRADTASAVYRANNYAKLKGAISGRLLTYEEAMVLETKANSLGSSSNVYKMLWGKENTGNGYLNYWLGSARSVGDMWHANGEYVYFTRFSYDIWGNGVRPVITVYKTSLQK